MRFGLSEKPFVIPSPKVESVQPKRIEVRFEHGFGDCANFAHMIPVYRSRGYQIAVSCTPDKRMIFEGVGAEILAPETGVWHPWHNPSWCTSPTPANSHQFNKTAINFGVSPLPNVGDPALLWRDLCQTRLNLDAMVNESNRAVVNRFIHSLPRPLILIHTSANTSNDAKTLPADDVLCLYHRLLDRMPGTLILLDWDNRVPKMANYRVRHLSDDFQTLILGELYYLMQQSDLLIGVDSGPLHFSRFSKIPAIGLWTRHYPSQYAIPCEKTLHLVHSDHAGIDRSRRMEFNTVLCPSGLGFEFIADHAIKMLSMPAREIQLQNLIQRTRSHSGSLSGYIDRNKTFQLVVDHLRSKETPVMVETGCVRSPDDFGGAGYSSYVIGAALRLHGKGSLTSVDLSGENCNFARECCAEFSSVQVVQAHSHDFLRGYNGPKMDVFYSDSLDADQPGHAENCLTEIQMVQQHLADDALILIDDTVWSCGGWRGKGALAVPWLLSHGWVIVHAGYQALLRRRERINMVAIPEATSKTPTSLQESLADIERNLKLSDREILGSLLQRDDGIHFLWLEKNNTYTVYAALGKHFAPKRIIEIGTRFGYSLKALLLGSLQVNPPEDVELFSFDNESYVKGCGEIVKQHFAENFPKVCLRYTLVDTQTLSVLEAPAADLVHVDAGHKMGEALHDLDLAKKNLLEAGGVIVCDDVTINSEVYAAVRMFCDKNQYTFDVLPTYGGLTIIQIPKGSP